MGSFHTVKSLAAAAKRSEGAITKLLKAGKLKGEQASPKAQWRISGAKVELVAQIHQLVPRGGYGAKVKKQNTAVNTSLVVMLSRLTAEQRAKITKLLSAPADTLDAVLSLIE